MFKKFSYVQRNKMLLPLAGIGVILCWFLAFSNTFEAMALNRKLNRESLPVGGDVSFNPAHAQRKLMALDSILKGYEVKKSRWNDDLWMRTSSIAAKYDVGIEYMAGKDIVERDSTVIGSLQTLHFYGGYVQLVKLIDTLEGVPGIGKISALQVKAPKKSYGSDEVGECVLRLDFRAVEE